MPFEHAAGQRRRSLHHGTKENFHETSSRSCRSCRNHRADARAVRGTGRRADRRPRRPACRLCLVWPHREDEPRAREWGQGRGRIATRRNGGCHRDGEVRRRRYECAEPHRCHDQGRIPFGREAMTAPRRHSTNGTAKVPDLAVIGAGSAGFAAAIAAAERGAHVALIGHGTIGGTCVNTGCVPSKTLIRAMESVRHAKSAARFAGVRADGRVQDWRAVVGQKDELVLSLRQSKYADLLPSYNGIAYIEGRARLTNDGVTVDESPIKAGKVIIATGASPSVPPIPGIEAVPYLTSTTALELDRLPKSLLVIGGGYIGCELGQLFARAGVKVTIVDILPILSAAEPEIANALAGYLRDEGIVIREGVKTTAVRKTGRGVALDISGGGRDETIEAEHVLVATGRRPNTASMGLEEGGVELLANGGIKVDEWMRTTRPGIYAAGVFTDPQVASVGLTEATARGQGLAVKTAVLPLAYVPRALAARDTRGLIKLIAAADSGKLLGAHILAPEGAVSIQTAALAITCGLTVQQIADTIFPYLTTVEGLKLAAQTFTKDVARLSCCAG